MTRVFDRIRQRLHLPQQDERAIIVQAVHQPHRVRILQHRQRLKVPRVEIVGNDLAALRLHLDDPGDRVVHRLAPRFAEEPSGTQHVRHRLQHLVLDRLRQELEMMNVWNHHRKQHVLQFQLAEIRDLANIGVPPRLELVLGQHLGLSKHRQDPKNGVLVRKELGQRVESARQPRDLVGKLLAHPVRNRQRICLGRFRRGDILVQGPGQLPSSEAAFDDPNDHWPL